MNRILQVSDNKFLVLLTPNYVSNPSFELLLDNFSDENIRNCKIVEFPTMESAMELAFKYPSIDWNKLVLIHEDAFHSLRQIIKQVLEHGNYVVELDSHLMSPREAKEAMFNRVMILGNRFNLYYDMNDIICINIINPWTKNLLALTNILKNIPELRIKKIFQTKTHIKLIGLNDVGTVYEIRLWTDLLAQWARRLYIHKLNPELFLSELPRIMHDQKIIDDGIVLR